MPSPVRQESAPDCEVGASPHIPGGCVVVLLRRTHHPASRKLSDIMTRLCVPRSHLAGNPDHSRRHQLHRRRRRFLQHHPTPARCHLHRVRRKQQPGTPHHLPSHSPPPHCRNSHFNHS